jgi:uridine kinase
MATKDVKGHSRSGQSTLSKVITEKVKEHQMIIKKVNKYDLYGEHLLHRLRFVL